MAVTTVNGRQVGYMEMGAGDPILFAHCSLGYSGLWRGVMERLADSYHCLSIDLPGHAQSERGNEDISLQHQAIEYLLGLADEKGVDSAHLVGLSLGGAIMTRLTHHHPGRVRSLSIFEPILFHFLTKWDPAAKDADRVIMDPVREAVFDGRPHEGARLFMEGWGQPGQFDKMPKAGQDAIATALTYIAHDFPWASDWPEGQITEDDVRAILQPTIIGHGERTHNSAKVVNAGLAGLFPNVRQVEIAGAGHLSPVDDPAQVADTIRSFLKDAAVA